MDHLVVSTAMLERFSTFLADDPPTLEDILGSACELYRVDPDDITLDHALLPKRVFCYCAQRLARECNREIGAHVGLNCIAVGKAANHVRNRLKADALLRDDLDLVVIRIVERVMIRKHQGRT